MIDRDRGPIDSKIEFLPTPPIEITPTGIYSIPSDEPTNTTLAIARIPTGDVALWIHDLKLERFIRPIRINSYAGGGPYPFIHDELVNLIRVFNKTDGQIPTKINSSKATHQEILPSYVATEVIKGKDNDSFSLKVKNIESLEDANDYTKSSFDITVDRSGNITLTSRTEYEDEIENEELKIVFNTLANRGKYPFLAESFLRIAQKLERAKKR